MRERRARCRRRTSRCPRRQRLNSPSPRGGRHFPVARRAPQYADPARRATGLPRLPRLLRLLGARAADGAHALAHLVRAPLLVLGFSGGADVGWRQSREGRAAQLAREVGPVAVLVVLAVSSKSLLLLRRDGRHACARTAGGRVEQQAASAARLELGAQDRLEVDLGGAGRVRVWFSLARRRRRGALALGIVDGTGQEVRREDEVLEEVGVVIVIESRRGRALVVRRARWRQRTRRRGCRRGSRVRGVLRRRDCKAGSRRRMRRDRDGRVRDRVEADIAGAVDERWREADMREGRGQLEVVLAVTIVLCVGERGDRDALASHLLLLRLVERAHVVLVVHEADVTGKAALLDDAAQACVGRAAAELQRIEALEVLVPVVDGLCLPEGRRAKVMHLVAGTGRARRGEEDRQRGRAAQRGRLARARRGIELRRRAGRGRRGDDRAERQGRVGLLVERQALHEAFEGPRRRVGPARID